MMSRSCLVPPDGARDALVVQVRSDLCLSRRRQKVAGLWLGNTGLNRSPKAKRLIRPGGEMDPCLDDSRRENPGFLAIALSLARLAIRKSASPKKVPPIPLAIWSLMEAGVFSPPISQRKAAHIRVRNDSQ